MSDDTARAGLPIMPVAVDQPAVLHNEALLQLDALLCARFLDRDLAAPPASPVDGDTYLVHATASGDWTGQNGKIAYAVDGAWRFYPPFTGLAAYVVDECRLIVFDGTSWIDYASILNLANVPLLGVNTTADATNKLAAKSSAVLFDNIGNGIQAKLNKHAVGDTASLLYQTNYSGRAEIGLTGDDNFHVKVSPDGSSWFDGLDIANADGAVDFVASEASVASATTADIGATSSLKVQITGTTTITSFGTKVHKLRFVRFAGALTLTHNATSLILLGGASRTTAAGDTGIYTSDSSGNWRERNYCRAASNPGDYATKTGTETLTNKTLSSPAVSGTISGTIATDTAFAASRSGVATGVTLTSYTASSAIGGYVQFSTARGTSGSPAAMQNGDYTGYFDQFGHDGTSMRRTAQFIFGVGGAVSTGIVPGEFKLYLTDTSGTLQLRQYVTAAGAFLPGSDNAQTLGGSSNRWSTVYAGTGTINTSGAKTKANTRPLDTAEIAVATALAANVRIFQFCDAVAAKGAAAARLHAGMIHEDVAAAFAAQGLDPTRYGIVCADPAFKVLTTPVLDPDTGAAVTRSECVPDLDAGGRQKQVLGLRYDELTQFVIAGLAARLAALEER